MVQLRARRPEPVEGRHAPRALFVADPIGPWAGTPRLDRLEYPALRPITLPAILGASPPVS